MQENINRKRKQNKAPLLLIAGCLVVSGAVSGVHLLVNNSVKVENVSSEESEISSVEESSVDEKELLIQSYSPTGKVTLQPGVNLSEEMQQLLLDYTLKKQEAIGKLKYIPLDEFFDKDNHYGELYRYFCNTSEEYLINVRKNRLQDFRYISGDFEIVITSVEQDEQELVVDYYINEAVEYACTGVTSYSCLMEGEARITEKDGKVLLTQMAEDTDVNLLIEEKVMNSLGFDYEQYYLKDMIVPEGIDYEHLFSSIEKELEEKSTTDIEKQTAYLNEVNSGNKHIFTRTADVPYNAEKAVEYSYNWVGKDSLVRNPEYSDYGIYGGNCQNYVSQALHYSGIPMDWDGESKDLQWKWFNDEQIDEPINDGRVPSWSGTENFYNYVLSNEGAGLVAEVTDNIYSAEVGDVIQYVIDGWSHHSVIVSGIVYDDEGNVVDLLINSNTTDRIDFPMSAYGYTDIRLIHIVGYNE